MDVLDLIPSARAARAIIATISAPVATTIIPSATAATAAAVASTATATIVTTAGSTGSASTASPILFVGFFYGHFLSTDGGVVQGLYRLASFCIIRHVDKAKALTLSCFPVHHYFSKIYGAVQFEHLFQVYIIEIVRKTCYKKLHADRFKR